MSGHTRGIIPIVDTNHQEVHVETATNIVEPVIETIIAETKPMMETVVAEPVMEAIVVDAIVEMETESPTSPPSQQSPIPIDLGSPPRDTVTQSHSLGIQGPNIPPSSEVSQDSFWLESLLGRKRERPSYQLDFTEFDHCNVPFFSMILVDDG